MIIWGVVVGALLGWCVAGFEELGSIAGAIAGTFAGIGLRVAVRSEISAATAELRAATQALREASSGRGTGREAIPVTGAPDPEPSLPPETVRADEHARNIAFPAGAPGFAEAAEQLPPKASSTVRDGPMPPRRPADQTPTIVDHAFVAAKNWLLGGNTIVRVGLVILFVGLSFLARWAAGAGYFPVELRLALVALAGIAILTVGFRKREARPAFALATEGAGVAILYLTIFAAGPLFGLIPLTAAFVIMILVCALGCALALLQDAQGLAVASFVGGYAVPLLLGGQGGNMIVPFTYYAILNIAVLVIAERRSWRIVNLVGFLATFGVATLWGVLRYEPSHYAVAQCFLIVSVLIYVAAAVLYARNTPGRLGNVVDTTLLFGPALAGFGLQVGLVRPFAFGAAFSALGFAALYIALAAGLTRYRRNSFRLMIECMIAIGVGFVTLTIPLALGVRWTAPAWALEGTGAFWVGMRQARWMPRLFGLLLQVFAACAFLGSIGANVDAVPLANPVFVAGMLTALSAFAIAWWLRQPSSRSESVWGQAYERVESALPDPAFLFGFLFWCLALVLEICRSQPSLEAGIATTPVFGPSLQWLLSMLAIVASAWVASSMGRRWQWPVATWPGRCTLPVLALGFIGQAGTGANTLETPSWAIWLVALALHYHLMWRNDVSGTSGAPALLHTACRANHVASVWLLALLVADCLRFGIDRGRLWNTSWSGVIFLVSAILLLAALTLWAGRANVPERREVSGWPLHAHAGDYYWWAALPLAVLIYTGTLAAAFISSGHTEPLPYVPLLNPTDLTLALGLCVLLLWRRIIASAEPRIAYAQWLDERNSLIAGGVLGFAIVNTMWLRLAHHLLGVGWNPEDLFDSYVVETGIAILWTLLALGLMVVARRRLLRGVWLAGAVLLGLVVLKLFFVDLSNAGGGERIVTFIAVGVLMLVVGYFAPLPPKSAGQPAVAAEGVSG